MIFFSTSTVLTLLEVEHGMIGIICWHLEKLLVGAAFKDIS